MHFDTASEQLSALGARRITATELLERTFERIDRVDPALNSIVVQDRDHARRSAAQADAALDRGAQQQPLLGLPMTVKECFDIAGMPTTWGLPGTRDIPVQRDSVVVRRLRDAGAIVLGKTNVPPNLADWQSSNPVYGTTNNPWDLTRSPGGSSGGAAAALAAGLVALEIGTDIGGSLRVPAHCCGVYAHKPTWGLVPMRGCAPPGTPLLAVSNPVDLAVAGPMARCAADLEITLDVIAGPDDDQARGYSLKLPPPRHQHLKGFRVLTLREHPLLPTGIEVGDTMRAWIDRISNAGCEVADTSPLLPDLMQAAQTYTRLLLAFFGANFPQQEYDGIRHAAAAAAAGEESLQALELHAFASSHRDWIAADRVRTGIRDAWQRVFERWDVVVCPVMPLTALPHDNTPMQQRTIQIGDAQLPYTLMGTWAGLATLAGLPATAMPIGIGASGLPIGVQAIGAQFEDRTTIAFARLAEGAFGGFVAPPAMCRSTDSQRQAPTR